MEVRCPKCNVRYDIEPSMVKKGPVRLQCSACDTIFRLQPQAPSTSWKVRLAETGEVLELDGLPELQRWIVERRVTRTDDISRSGKQWKPLGSIAELASFFAVIDQLDQAASSDFSIVSDALDPSPSPSDETTRAAESPAAKHEERTVKADAQVLADLSASIEQALDSGLGVGEEDDHDAQMAEALLESLGLESHVSVRRPVSGVQDPQALRDLLSRQAQAEPVVEATWNSEPIQLEATAVEVPQPRVGGTEALPVARPAANVSETEATTVRSASHDDAYAPPDIGPTGAAWFDDASAPAQEPPEFESVGTQLDREITNIGRTSSGTVWVAAVIGLVVLAIVIVLVMQGGDSDESDGNKSASGADNGTPRDPIAPNAPDVSNAPQDVAQMAVTDLATDTQSATDATTVSASDAMAAPADVATDVAVATATDVSPTMDGGNAAGDPAGATDGPRSFKTLIKAGDKARERGRYAEAIRHYESAQSKKGGSAEASSGIGWSYLGMGQAGKAIREFEAALSHSKSYEKAYTGLAKAYEKAGRHKDALGVWERYLEQFPSGSQSSIAKAQTRRLKQKIGIEEPKVDPPNDPPKEDPKTVIKKPDPKEDPPKDDPKKIIIIKKN